MEQRSDIDLTALRSRLLARRAELEPLAERSHEESRPVELDQTRVGRLSRMDALQGQAMAAETERRRHQELECIAAAFKRMAEGDYGYCLSCGEPIPVKRLDADPTTPLCVACAAGPSADR
ncbi:MAG: TraR/DksA family transcriptional regulator [Kiloniellales bacterium]